MRAGLKVARNTVHRGAIFAQLRPGADKCVSPASFFHAANGGHAHKKPRVGCPGFRDGALTKSGRLQLALDDGSEGLDATADTCFHGAQGFTRGAGHVLAGLASEERLLDGFAL